MKSVLYHCDGYCDIKKEDVGVVRVYLGKSAAKGIFYFMREGGEFFISMNGRIVTHEQCLDRRVLEEDPDALSYMKNAVYEGRYIYIEYVQEGEQLPNTKGYWTATKVHDRKILSISVGKDICEKLLAD